MLGDCIYANPTNIKQKLVRMLHTNTLEKVKDEIIISMTTDAGYALVFLCTIAFGKGVNCKDVNAVIRLGPSKMLLDPMFKKLEDEDRMVDEVIVLSTTRAKC